jgi:hypothetical protein
MSDFSSYSHFHPTHTAGSHERTAEENLRQQAIPVRHVGQANIVEIPLKSLEEWTAEIEFIVSDMQDTSDQASLGSILDEMRSYFKG